MRKRKRIGDQGDGSSSGRGNADNLEQLFRTLIDNASLSSNAFGSAIEMLHRQKRIRSTSPVLVDATRVANQSSRATDFATFCFIQSSDVRRSYNGTKQLEKTYLREQIIERTVGRYVNERLLRGNPPSEVSGHSNVVTGSKEVEICLHQIRLLDDKRATQTDDAMSLRRSLVDTLVCIEESATWLAVDPDLLRPVVATNVGVGAAYVRALLSEATACLNQRVNGDENVGRCLRTSIRSNAVKKRLRLLLADGGTGASQFCAKALRQWGRVGDNADARRRFLDGIIPGIQEVKIA